LKTPQNKNSANYSNLNVGNYILRVKSTNCRGVWNSKVASIKLIITPSNIAEELWFFPLMWFLIILTIIFLIVIFMKIKEKRENEKNRKIKESLEHQAQLASLQALRSQMNPHFLYNVLNSVNSFISKNDIPTANSFLVDFGQLMRNILDNSQQHIVSLQKELDFIKLYLDFEHLRFGDKFDYILDIDKSLQLENIFIPSMIIQPFIENAIKHGLLNRKDKGQLKINLYKENQNLIFIVEDNGIGRKKSIELRKKYNKNTNQSGIKNITERLSIIKKLYKKEIILEIYDNFIENKPKGTIIKILFENPENWNL
jgi:LytS/YehU family sensor histidine kinase